MTWKIVVDATSSFTGSEGNKISPVSLHPYGDIVKLLFQDSKKHAGLIPQPALAKLLEEFGVRLTGIISAATSRPSQTRSREKKVLIATQDCSVRIIVYGLKDKESVIGDILSESGLYLQQPSATECDRGVEYSNPHYLVRPGRKMPILSDSSGTDDVRKAMVPETLDEVKRNQFMQIFDVATDSGIQSQIKASPRLRSILKEYVAIDYSIIKSHINNV
jgi:hypothetical protein